MRQFFDSKMRPVQLGGQLGSGGEGAVYEIIGRPQDVAKIYHKPMDAERAGKISAMSAVATSDLLSTTAWPSDLVTEAHKPVGLIMPKITSHKDIHKLYSPKSRKQEFPAADFKFLVCAAANVARAFATVHKQNHVIGDVNHGSVIVAGDATAKLIDCDSFQITNGTKIFKCTVGTATFTPPELQGRPFAGVVRTVDHDNFGLAVLIFHLLFLGRHPFAGRYAGRGDMPIETAIQQFRFAYGADRGRVQMEPPPNVPSLTAMGSAVATLFERAFSSQSAKPGVRPSAHEWAAALKEFGAKTVKCRALEGHIYPAEAGTCPWCRIENSTGVLLFHVVATAGAQTTFDINVVWRQIEAVQVAPMPPPLSESQFLAPQPSPEAAKAAEAIRGRKRKKSMGTIVLIIAVLCLLATAPAAWLIWLGGGFGIYHWLLDQDDIEVSRFASALKSAEAQHRESLARYEAIRTGFASSPHNPFSTEKGPKHSFHQIRSQLQAKKQEWIGLPQRRAAKIQQLEANKRAQQLSAFLSNFFIEHADIPGIGSGRKATLESFGIETADDVEMHKVLNVPGFGPAMTKKLMEWRKKVEQKFRFDPTKAVDPAEVRAVDQELARARQGLEKVLQCGASELAQQKRQLEIQQAAVKRDLEQSIRQLLQARADRAAIVAK